MPRALLAALLVLSASFLGAVAPVQANGSYTITVENGEVEIPEQTVDIRGDSYDVSSVAPIEPGEDIDVTVSQETDERYDLSLFDRNQNLVESKLNTTQTSASFSTDTLDPGTYTLAYISRDTRTLQTIQPVVISAYETTVTAPSEVAADENASIEITTTTYDSVDAPEIESVRAVLANESSSINVTATQDGDSYTATLDEEYTPGDYRLYAVVAGPGQVGGEFPNIISLSDEQSLTITEAADDESTNDETDESGGGGGGGGGGGAPANDTESEPTNTTNTTTNGTESAELNSTDSVAQNGTDTETESANGTETGNSNADTGTSDNSQDTTENNSQVTEPSEPNPDQATDESVPLNGPTLLLVGLLVVAIGIRIKN